MAMQVRYNKWDGRGSGGRDSGLRFDFFFLPLLFFFPLSKSGVKYHIIHGRYVEKERGG